MPEGSDQTRPMVCRCTCFDADPARWQIGKETRNLPALKLSSHDDPAGGVNAVDLEHALGEIKTNCGNLHAGGSSLVPSSNDDHARHSMPFRRGRPPHQLQMARHSGVCSAPVLVARPVESLLSNESHLFATVARIDL
jgi:hypothetical protein